MQNISLPTNDNINRATFASIPCVYRKGTTDENALVEVLITRAYSRLGFDVCAGEMWCDLGAPHRFVRAVVHVQRGNSNLLRTHAR